MSAMHLHTQALLSQVTDKQWVFDNNFTTDYGWAVGNSFAKYSIYVMHDHGFPVAVCIASNTSEALDLVIDNSDKLDPWKLDFADNQTRRDYAEADANGTLSYLGNNCEPYDIETLTIEELPLIELTPQDYINVILSRSQTQTD